MFDAQGFDGILSISVLRDVVATIDLRGRTLRLEQGSLPEPDGRDLLPIAGADPAGRIDVPIRIAGVDATAVIDTRSSLWLMAPDALESKLPFAAPLKDIGMAVGPSLGQFKMRGARLSGDVRIGDHAIAHPAIVLRDRPASSWEYRSSSTTSSRSISTPSA